MFFDNCKTPEELYEAIETLKKNPPATHMRNRTRIRNGGLYIDYDLCPPEDFDNIYLEAMNCLVKLRASNSFLSDLPNADTNSKIGLVSVQNWCIKNTDMAAQEEKRQKQTQKAISVRDVKCQTIISDLETLGLQGMLKKHHLFYEDGGLEFEEIVGGTKFALQLCPDIERIWETKNISDCIKLLKEILPNWTCCQMRHPEVARYLLISIHFWLTALRAECPREIPPIPSDLLGIQDWITDVERALAKTEAPKVQNGGKAKDIQQATPESGWFKHIVEKAWQIFTKSFWEAVFDRFWPK